MEALFIAWPLWAVLGWFGIVALLEVGWLVFRRRALYEKYNVDPPGSRLRLFNDIATCACGVAAVMLLGFAFAYGSPYYLVWISAGCLDFWA